LIGLTASELSARPHQGVLSFMAKIKYRNHEGEAITMSLDNANNELVVSALDISTGDVISISFGVSPEDIIKAISVLRNLVDFESKEQ